MKYYNVDGNAVSPQEWLQMPATDKQTVYNNIATGLVNLTRLSPEYTPTPAGAAKYISDANTQSALEAGPGGYGTSIPEATSYLPYLAIGAIAIFFFMRKK